jgi:low affinity Fe/Cu permease
MKLADPSPPPPDSATVGPPAPADADPGPPGSSFKLPLHVNARGMALGITATVAFVWALQWSEKFLVPLLLGVFIAYTLSPVVAWLERWHIKRAIGATLVTVAIVAAMVGVLYRVQGEIVNIVDELPALTHKVTKLLTDNASGQPSTIQQMRAAAAEIEQATANVGADAAASGSWTGCWPARWASPPSSARPPWWCSWYFSCCWPATPSSASWSS